MQSSVLHALEFDRIREALARETVTGLGRARARALEPEPETETVERRLATTGEAAALLRSGGSLSVQAPENLDQLLQALRTGDDPLEPGQLLSLSRACESVGQVAATIRRTAEAPLLQDLVAPVTSFAGESAAVERAIEPSGDISDDASPALREVRNTLRRHRAKLRSTLEGLARGQDTAKYLQDQIIADRNGRYVIVVRAEHRDAIPGLVHGSSASGASLYLEPMSTVGLNNDIVALVEREQREVFRILVALTGGFRLRLEELADLFDAAAGVDEVQAKARLALRMDGRAPRLVTDRRIEFRGARHPLLIPAVRDLLAEAHPTEEDRAPANPVASDLLVQPPTSALVISGPNTGGKTVALKAFGLLALMAQSGLFIPVDEDSAFTPFATVFADIGDEQSISASLSTFSARVANTVAMEKALRAPALVLLDEVGSGTDPVEGGALGTAVIDHFRQRGAIVIATTHDDALKSYAATTAGVAAAAFGFSPDTYAPSYRLVYGAPGRSLALEIAERLGMPEGIIADARARRSGRESQLAAHLARVDRELSSLEDVGRQLEADRASLAQERDALRARESRLTEREAVLKKRLNDKLHERLREARAEVDAVVAELRQKADSLADRAQQRARLRQPVLSTGELGNLRTRAKSTLDAIGEDLGTDVPRDDHGEALTEPPEIGASVFVATFSATGIVKAVFGAQVEVDMRGKRMRMAWSSLRHAGRPATATPNRGRAAERPRSEGARPEGERPLELMVIGNTVDQALDRAGKFLDDAILSDARRLRVIHGHGTGRLREAMRRFFREHALVASVAAAPDNEGGAGATIVELKD